MATQQKRPLFPAIEQAQVAVSQLISRKPVKKSYSAQPAKPTQIEAAEAIVAAAIVEIEGEYGVPASVPHAQCITLRAKEQSRPCAIDAYHEYERPAPGNLTKFKIVKLNLDGTTYMEFMTIPHGYSRVNNYAFDENVLTMLKQMHLQNQHITGCAQNIKDAMIKAWNGQCPGIDGDVLFAYTEMHAWEYIVMKVMNTSLFHYARVLMSLLLSLDGIMRTHHAQFSGGLTAHNGHIGLLVGILAGCISAICALFNADCKTVHNISYSYAAMDQAKMSKMLNF